MGSKVALGRFGNLSRINVGKLGAPVLEVLLDDVASGEQSEVRHSHPCIHLLLIVVSLLSHDDLSFPSLWLEPAGEGTSLAGLLLISQHESTFNDEAPKAEECLFAAIAERIAWARRRGVG
jgi:hypothetical protein